MNHVLIIDVETTGIDPTKDKIIEVGCVRYSVRHAQMVECFSTLLPSKSNPAEKINRISPALLEEIPNDDVACVWKSVAAFAEGCDAYVAHHADFDRGFISQATSALPDLPWIDTCGGVRWPLEMRPGDSLVKQALAHGVGVMAAHRSISDCLLLAALITRCRELGNDIELLLSRGLRPEGWYVALVDYDNRQIAKDAGFQWDARGRVWFRKLAREDAAALPFKVREVQPQQ